MGVAGLLLLRSVSLYWCFNVLIHLNRPNLTGASGQAAQINLVNMTSLSTHQKAS